MSTERAQKIVLLAALLLAALLLAPYFGLNLPDPEVPRRHAPALKSSGSAASGEATLQKPRIAAEPRNGGEAARKDPDHTLSEVEELLK